MTQLFDFLNKNAGALNVLFALVVAGSTVFYVILTNSLVKETKKLREAQTQPKLSVTIKQREECASLIDLVIENIGAGPAYRIQFNVKSQFKADRGKLLSDLNLFRNGLSYLAPRQSVQFFLTSLFENFKEKIANPLILDVTYLDAANNKHTDSFQIDFSWLEGLIYLSEPDMPKSLEGIEKNTKEIVGELQKLRQKHG
jgi:hypothetical protein